MSTLLFLLIRSLQILRSSVYSYLEKGCRKNVHATIPKGNMGYDQYTLFLTTVAVEPTFVAFFQLLQTHFHALSCQFFQISLKKGELKTTYNAFQDCRVHFSRQPFSKQLYIRFKGTCSNSRECSNFGFPKIYVANSNLTNQNHGRLELRAF